MKRSGICLLAVWLIGFSKGAIAQELPLFELQPQELSSRFGNGSNDLALGDLDGDGDLDAIVAQTNDEGESAQNVVWWNTGDVWVPAPACGNAASRAVAAEDLDGDGDVDVWMANDQADEIWINQGGAQLGASGEFILGSTVQMEFSNGVVLGDLDGDGDLDAVVSGWPSRVWLNQGDATFREGAVLRPDTLGQFIDWALGDIDGDGDVDLLSGGSGLSSPPMILFNVGGGEFEEGPTIAVAENNQVGIHDLDGDGAADLTFATDSGLRILWQRTPVGGATLQFEPFTVTGAGDVDAYATGDLDGNGSQDLLLLQNLSPSGIRLAPWLGLGQRQFSEALAETCTECPSGGGSLSVALGDMDGDGPLDAMSSTPEGQNSVWINLSPTEPNTRPPRDPGMSATREGGAQSLYIPRCSTSPRDYPCRRSPWVI